MLIGLTGGIGSGKSTIAAELKRLGYSVFDTDWEAKRIIVHNPAVRSQIELLFGSDVFDGDTYLTNKVAAQVFADPTLLDRLNHIVHPAVRYELEHWYKSFSEAVFQRSGLTSDSEAVCFVESAILYESGLYQLCDQVVDVIAPEEVRIARVIARDHTDIDSVRARIRAQEAARQSCIVHRQPIILNNDGTTPIPDLVHQLLQQICVSLHN